MKKSKVEKEERTVHDLDMTIVLRSSRMKSKELSNLFQLIAETVNSNLTVSLVEQDTNVNQNYDRTLYSFTAKLQSND